MSQALSLPDRSPPGSTMLARTALLSKVVYRSRAVHPLTPVDLQKLTLAAQARNRAESITGLMLYDDDRFFQWLEGPTDALERIMRSIRNDPRHTDIEVLRQEPADARRFSGWDLKLATSLGSAPRPHDAIEAPLEIIGDLRKHPSNTPVLLERLVGASPHVPADQDPGHSAGTLRGRTAAVLKTVILRTVVPQLALQHGLAQPGPGALPLSPRVAELADLLIASDQTAAFELIDELHTKSTGSLTLYASLFEPAARALGDLWSEDSCSEFDVTLGLCRIQTAVRLLGASSVRRAVGLAIAPAVLIAPEPGEMHRLGATLDSEVLRHAGWTPQCEYPSDDKALQDILAATWFDVLDLSLSAAFRREHWLPRLTNTIANARRASRNAALLVIVGGRIFGEVGTAGALVGADSANISACHVEHSILQGLGDASAGATMRRQWRAPVGRARDLGK